MIPLSIGKGKGGKGGDGVKLRCRIIGGKPAACRLCRFVGRVDGAAIEGTVVQVLCCRSTPPARFDWRMDGIEPFCGHFGPTDGDVETTVASACAEGPAPKHESPSVVPFAPPTAKPEPRPPVEVPPVRFGPPKNSGVVGGSTESHPVAYSAASLRADLGSVSLSLRGADEPNVQH